MGTRSQTGNFVVHAIMAGMASPRQRIDYRIRKLRLAIARRNKELNKLLALRKRMHNGL